MDLFPTVLLRVAGGAFADFDALQLQTTWERVEQIRALDTSIEACATRCADALHEDVGACADSKTRGVLIGLRRDVHNKRQVRPSTLALSGRALSATTAAELDDYLHLKRERDAAFEAGRASYTDEVPRLRRTLQHLAQDEQLRNGLVLSSHSLLSMIPDYVGVEGSSIGPVEAKTELGLLRYISRMYTKTSPFSTFTLLATGDVVRNGSAEVFGFSGSGAVTSHVRLNTLLYLYIRQLVFSNRELYRSIPVRPNPTLWSIGDQFAFLVNSNNVESFQRLRRGPLLDVFLAAVSAPQVVPYGDAVHAITEGGRVDANKEQVESYMDNLISYGFFEFNLGASGTDPDWDLALAHALAPAAKRAPAIKELLGALTVVRQLASQYEKGDPNTRVRILDEAFSIFRTSCTHLHEAAGLPAAERADLRPTPGGEGTKSTPIEPAEAGAETTPSGKRPFRRQTFTRFAFAPTQMYFEDATIDIRASCDARQLELLVQSAEEVIARSAILTSRIWEQASMVAYFDRKYDARATIPLLTFYEDFYRDVKLPDARQRRERERATGGERADLAADRTKVTAGVTVDGTPDSTVDLLRGRQRAWLQALRERVAARQHQDGIVRLQSGDIPDSRSGATSAQNAGIRNSRSFFVQPFLVHGPDTAQLQGVLNVPAPGFGKLFSRFLHLFDHDLTEQLRARNESVAVPGYVLAENCDASFFNANLHPPLMPFEVWMPGSNNNLPGDRQIPITALAVQHATADELCLIHAVSGARVYVFDLGFQSRKGRSELFQLLDQFTPAWPGPLQAALRGEPAESPEPAAVRVTPRVVYNDRLILSRKAWYVRGEALPRRANTEDSWDYLLRLDAWRRELDIPDHVFVRVVGMTTPSGPEDTRAEPSRDARKPQYISFRNPFLVRLFARLAAKVPPLLVIEEMVPAPEQLLRVGQQRRVVELLVEWHTPLDA